MKTISYRYRSPLIAKTNRIYYGMTIKNRFFSFLKYILQANNPHHRFSPQSKRQGCLKLIPVKLKVSGQKRVQQRMKASQQQ